MAAGLVTERLALRRFIPADAGDLLALDGDPAVMRFLEGRTKSLPQIEAEVLPRFLTFHTRYPSFGYWAADLRSDGTFIGWFGLRAVTPTAGAMVHWPDATGDAEAAELGYRLRPGGARVTRLRRPALPGRPAPSPGAAGRDPGG